MDNKKSSSYALKASVSFILLVTDNKNLIFVYPIFVLKSSVSFILLVVNSVLIA